MKRVLVFTPWFPTPPDHMYDYTFVKDQVKVLDTYFNKLDKKNIWKFTVWHQGFATDLVNKYIRNAHTKRFSWSFNKKTTVFYNQGCILSHRLPFDQSFLLRRGQKETWLKVLEDLGGEPDLVWTITLSGSVAWYSFARYMGIQFPFVLHEHSNPITMHLKNASNSRLAQKAMEMVNEVIIVAGRQFEELKRELNYTSPILIHNCAGKHFFLEKPGKDRNKQLVFVGRLSEEKGVSRLFTAFFNSKAKNQGWRLIIIGDGPERESLEELVVKLGIESEVEFLGFKNEREIINVLDSSDAFVLPSYFENCPVALIEALARGVPALVTRNGSSELLMEATDGVVIDDKGDGVGLTEGIDTLIERIGIFNKPAIQKAAYARYSPQKFATDFLEVFIRAIS